MRSATEYVIPTRQAERALKAGNCTPSFRLRDQRGVEVASETLPRAWPAAPYLLHQLVLPGMQPGLAGVPVPPAVGRGAGGASLVSISQQTVAENAKARTQLKLGFPILLDRG